MKTNLIRAMDKMQETLVTYECEHQVSRDRAVELLTLALLSKVAGACDRIDEIADAVRDIRLGRD